MKTTGNNVARVIKDARLKKRLSQNELAHVAGYKSGQFISNIERNHCGLPPKYAVRFALELGIDLQVIKEALIQDYSDALNRELLKHTPFRVKPSPAPVILEERKATWNPGIAFDYVTGFPL